MVGEHEAPCVSYSGPTETSALDDPVRRSRPHREVCTVRRSSRNGQEWDQEAGLSKGGRIRLWLVSGYRAGGQRSGGRGLGGWSGHLWRCRVRSAAATLPSGRLEQQFRTQRVVASRGRLPGASAPLGLPRDPAELSRVPHVNETTPTRRVSSLSKCMSQSRGRDDLAVRVAPSTPAPPFWLSVPLARFFKAITSCVQSSPVDNQLLQTALGIY